MDVRHWPTPNACRRIALQVGYVMSRTSLFRSWLQSKQTHLFVNLKDSGECFVQRVTTYKDWQNSFNLRIRHRNTSSFSVSCLVIRYHIRAELIKFADTRRRARHHTTVPTCRQRRSSFSSRLMTPRKRSLSDRRKTLSSYPCSCVWSSPSSPSSSSPL